jgi:hypothetical protein
MLSFNGNFMNKFFASIDAKRDAKIEFGIKPFMDEFNELCLEF